MPFCTSCGTEVQSSDQFCSACGGPISETSGVRTAGWLGPATPLVLPYRLSLTRVLLMSVLTHGIYLLYWFYLTWKQYRDHTRTEVFPVWHALTLLVPIYGLFRIHSHMRSYKDLMLDAGLATTISAGWAVVMVIVIGALDGAAFQAGGGFSLSEITLGDAMLITILDIISITIVAALIVGVQGNLNEYWNSLQNATLDNARVGVGEVVFGVIGVLLWVDTLASLLSSSYRMG